MPGMVFVGKSPGDDIKPGDGVVNAALDRRSGRLIDASVRDDLVIFQQMVLPRLASLIV